MIEESKFHKILIAIWIPIHHAIDSVVSFLILLIKKYAKIAMNQIRNNG